MTVTLIDRARAEYDELGVLPVDTFMALTNAGIDPATVTNYDREEEAN